LSNYSFENTINVMAKACPRKVVSGERELMASKFEEIDKYIEKRNSASRIQKQAHLIHQSTFSKRKKNYSLL
jgi:hypothetical protein